MKLHVPWPRVFRILILSSTSPVYKALWYWPLMSLRISAEQTNKQTNKQKEDITKWTNNKLNNSCKTEKVYAQITVSDMK